MPAQRLRRILSAVAACLLAVAFPGAASATVTINDTLIPLASTVVRTPESPGTVTYSGGGAKIDASNTAKGYIMVSYSGANGKVKLQITRSGKTTYTYTLSGGGKNETFPLTSGDGTYTVAVFENVSGNQYAQILSKNIEVKLDSATLPFLYPSQYVSFNANSAAVAKGAELAQGKTDDLAVVASVYNYVIGNITYDTQKAAQAQAGQLSGYLPNVDSVLSTKKGICFDYAALMTAMLRSQNIPTRLEVGYVSGGVYHAWISTYIADVGWVNNIIYFDGKSWKLMDPTFASSGSQSSSIMEFIGNGSNYSTMYIY